jgi:peptide-methionine (S)-S-oxide reductase
LDYDPSKASYTDLLEIFWKDAPTVKPAARQYTAAIYYITEDEHQLALQSLQEHEAELGRKTYVEILPLRAFYLAEDYHQKYYLKGSWDFNHEFQAMYPNEKELTNSTAATRVNGYAAGLGNEEVFSAEADSYGLSPAGISRLKEIGSRLFPPASGKSCAVLN